MQFGLLGRHLGHSYSPVIHKMLGSFPYFLFEKEPEDLDSFLKNGQFQGLNVTIPYKKSVIPFCRELSDTAKEIGAVNTIVRQDDGSLVGHNTDYYGFHSMVRKSGLNVNNKKVLILGSGGASVTAQAVLRKLGAEVVIISRKGQNHYDNLSLHQDASVIVNATPVGMYPNTGTSPISLDLFPDLEGVLDIIYNPARTTLLLDAEKRGLVTENGLWMLVAQAKESAQCFLKHSISDAKIQDIYSILRSQMNNIILIGMPGCGKTTVGKSIAEMTGRRFLDSDAEIVKRTGMSIPEIFAQRGEDWFRSLESEVLEELGKESGLVLATGGGCVTRAQNYRSLHQNGSIYWLTRPLQKLATEGRPLSHSEKMQELFEKRKPMYESFSDAIVDNQATPTETAACILGKENIK